MLSRNFRLQRVGDLAWLKNNYDFSKVSNYIDELIVLDVTRGEKNVENFREVLSKLAEGCFAPIAAGGGISSLASAKALFRSGADKVVVNSCLFGKSDFARELASEYGSQSVIASLDVKSDERDIAIYSHNGAFRIEGSFEANLQQVLALPIGEIYLNSMQRDGTGQGLELKLLERFPSDLHVPVILAGGIGNARHMVDGLKTPTIDAVATANLFNFVGNSLMLARDEIRASGVQLPKWNEDYSNGAN